MLIKLPSSLLVQYFRILIQNANVFSFIDSYYLKGIPSQTQFLKVLASKAVQHTSIVDNNIACKDNLNAYIEFYKSDKTEQNINCMLTSDERPQTLTNPIENTIKQYNKSNTIILRLSELQKRAQINFYPHFLRVFCLNWTLRWTMAYQTISLCLQSTIFYSLHSQLIIIQEKANRIKMIVQGTVPISYPVVFYFMPNFIQSSHPTLSPNIQLYHSIPYQKLQPGSPDSSTTSASQHHSVSVAKQEDKNHQKHYRENGPYQENGKNLKGSQEQINKLIINRNILPNNVNLVLSYMRRINKSGKTVAKIIDKLRRQDQAFTTKKFYSYQQYLKNTIENDINRHQLRNVARFCDPSCSIFSSQEQTFYNKVFRIATNHYLKEDGILNVLSSKKIYKSRRIDHLRSYRVIRKDIRPADQ